MSSIFGITKYLHTNCKITYPLVKFFFSTKKKKKKVKRVILSHIQKKKKKVILICIQMFVPVSICYLFEFKYFNYVYKKYIYKINVSKKKAHYLTEKLLILILYSNV